MNVDKIEGLFSYFKKFEGKVDWLAQVHVLTCSFTWK